MQSRRWTVLALATLLGASGEATEPPRPPVIDAHLHAQELWAPPGSRPVDLFAPTFDEPFPDFPAPASTEELQRLTLEALELHNVVKAITSGPFAEAYREARPETILASPLLSDATTPVEELRAAFEADRYQVLAELMPQYSGLPPNHPSLEPYFALAEELDIPVGIHVGPGPPGAAYGGFPEYRIAHSDALLLEDVLVAHPDLRLYVMHAGWPLVDSTVALLFAHPQVYVGIGVIDWAIPRAEFYRYLERLVDAGFSKRILFGSDQMLWPDAIGLAIETVESAPFLSEEQRRDILCRNATRFFRFDPALCE